MSHRRLVLFVALCLAFWASSQARAQTGEPPATPQEEPSQEARAPRPKPCASAEHRRFDFWEGTWDVENQLREGPTGRNEIRLEQGGCVVREEYTVGPYSGTSLSFYDVRARQWRQTWIDNQGQPLYLAGGWRDGAMVMTGPVGDTPTDRITWTPRDDGTVTQRWDKSEDGGETWKTAFDGLYTPASD